MEDSWEKVNPKPKANNDTTLTRTGRERRSLIPQLRQMTPFYPALMASGVTSSLEATILMTQLEYWFDKMHQEKGHWYFYKFVEPPAKTYGYKRGDSWCEELAFTPAQFRRAFNQIGVTYPSKSTFKKQLLKNPDDLFTKKVSVNKPKRDATGKVTGQTIKTEKKEFFYASVHDRLRYRAYFFRNEAAIDRAILQIAKYDSTAFSIYKKQEIDKKHQKRIQNKIDAREFNKLLNEFGKIDSHQAVNSNDGTYDNSQDRQLDYQEINLQEINNHNGNKGNKGVLSDKTLAFSDEISTDLPLLNQEVFDLPDSIFSSWPEFPTRDSGSVKASQNKRLVGMKMIKHFFDYYKQYMGEQHPAINKNQREFVYIQLDKWFEGDAELFETVVEQYFTTKFEDCDYRINHFVQDKILENRLFEVT